MRRKTKYLTYYINILEDKIELQNRFLKYWFINISLHQELRAGKFGKYCPNLALVKGGGLFCVFFFSGVREGIQYFFSYSYIGFKCVFVCT